MTMTDNPYVQAGAGCCCEECGKANCKNRGMGQNCEGQAIRGGGETGVANGDNQLAEGKMRVAKSGRRGRVGEVVRDQDRRSL